MNIRIFLPLLVVAGSLYAHDLVRVQDLNCPSIFVRLRYATEENITHQRIYTKADCCYMHKETALKLVNVAHELEKYGYGIAIWDAYQPKAELEKIWQLLPDETYITNPSKGDSHTCGMGIDITLVDLSTHMELEMPTPFDCITVKANCDCCDISLQARENRDLLKRVMMQHGFVQNKNDSWWHFELPGWQNCAMPMVSFEELS